MKKLLLSLTIAAAMVATFGFIPEAKANPVCCCSEWQTIHTYFSETGRYCQVWSHTCLGPNGYVVETFDTYAWE